MLINRLTLFFGVAFASLIVGGCEEQAAPLDSNVAAATLTEGAVTGDAGPAIALTGRITDQADLLDAAAEKALTEKLEKLEKEVGPQFVVATTKSLNGQAIERYSIDLARAWGIGHVDRKDGVILLVAPNERKVRIEVGYGLEGSLSDSFCAEVIREDILPIFKDGKMEEGIIAGADRLIEKMRMSPTIKLNDNDLSAPIEEKLAS